MNLIVSILKIMDRKFQIEKVCMIVIKHILKEKLILLLSSMKNLKRLIYYPNGLKNNHYTIPDEVEVIGERAFVQCVLQSITLSKSLKEIQKEAFYLNSKLQRIFITENVQRINEYAFGFNERLKEVVIVSKTINLDKGVFCGCKTLNNVLIVEEMD